jgi:hypothetical protein
VGEDNNNRKCWEDFQCDWLEGERRQNLAVAGGVLSSRASILSTPFSMKKKTFSCLKIGICFTLMGCFVLNTHSAYAVFYLLIYLAFMLNFTLTESSNFPKRKIR